MIKSTQYRLWTTLFVLLYLAAQLLPASTSTASAQADSCASVTAQAADAPALVVHAANEQVTIPKAKVDAAVFEAGLYSSALDKGRLFVEMQLMLSKATGQTDYAGPMKEYNDRINALFPVSNRINEHTYDEVVHTLLDTALQIPELAPVVPRIWSQLNDENSYSKFTVDSRTNIIQSAQRYDLGERILALAPEIAIQAHNCAQKNGYFAELFDTFNLDKLGFSIRDDAKTILANDTDLMVPEGIRNNIADDGTVTISLDQLKALGKSELDQLHTTINGMQDTLVEIDSQQKEIIDYLKDQELKAKYQELAKKKAAEYQLKLDAARAGISIITTISAQIDPKFAKDFNVVASSSLQVGTAINSWIKATAGLGSLDKIFSLSSVVMTGNILGAVMNVVSLFSDSGPTPEEQILEEIGRLRQQVNELRIEMHERFDRIDQGLNNIYTTMHERFDQIDIQLGKINGNIVEVQQSLFELDLKLSRIERNNFELINAVSRRPLLEAVNGALGYRQRTGSPMPEAAFAQFENQFHSWATLHAFDAGNVGPSQRDYSDAGLLKELTTYPIDANLNYLNGWMVAHGLPALSNKPLPSPRDWLLASRAYTQMGLEEAELMATFVENDAQRQEHLQEISLDMESAMQNIATQNTASGPQGNSALFTMVTNQYQNKLIGLDEGIQTLENDFLNEVQLQRLQRNEPFQLYGGIDQHVTYRPPALDTMTCARPAVHGTYTTPSNLMQDIPHFDRYNLAEYLKLGGFSICLSDEWVNPIQVCRRPGPGLPEICQTFATHTAYLTVNFSQNPILVKAVYDGALLLPASRAEFWTRDNWQGGLEYKTRFETASLVVPPSPEEAAGRESLFKTMTQLTENALSSYQKELYGRILNEMTNGALKTKTVELGGSKALLDNLVTLGLPRAASNDEFLHAMLYGDQQLVGDSQIMQSYAVSMTSPITGTRLMVNPRQLLAQTAPQRSAAFTSLINGYLDAITAQTHVEAPDYIANTRRALDLTMRIVQVETAPTPTLTPTPLPGGGQPTSTPGGDQPTATPVTGGQPTSTPMPGGEQPTATPAPGGQPTATPVNGNGQPPPVTGDAQPVYLPLVRR